MRRFSSSDIFLGLSVAMMAALACTACDTPEQNSDAQPTTEEVVEPAEENNAPKQEESAPKANTASKTGKELTPAEVTQACTVVCEKTSALPCVKVPTCIEGCKESFGMPVCQGEFGKMLQCTAAASADQFVCDSPEAPSLKDGVCAQAQEQAALCLGKMMGGGGVL